MISGHSATFATRRVDALVAAMTGSGGPGAAVGIARAGEPVYQGCFGLPTSDCGRMLPARGRPPSRLTTRFTWFTGYRSADEP